MMRAIIKYRASAVYGAKLNSAPRSSRGRSGFRDDGGGKTFCRGATVQVMSGAFRGRVGRVGLFDRADTGKRVLTLLDLTGRQTRGHIPTEAIRART